MQGRGDKPVDIQVDLATMETISCPACSSRLFEQQFVLKLIPKLLAGAPTDVPVPIPIWRCTDCGEILKQFIPKGVGNFKDLFGGGNIIER